MKFSVLMKCSFLAGATSVEFGFGKKTRAEVKDNILKVRYLDGDIKVIFNELDETYTVQVSDPIIGFYLKNSVTFTVTGLIGSFRAISKAYNVANDTITTMVEAKEA